MLTWTHAFLRVRGCQSYKKAMDVAVDHDITTFLSGSSAYTAKTGAVQAGSADEVANVDAVELLTVVGGY